MKKGNEKYIDFQKKTQILIDDLKSVCANYGLGNDGNEFKIITQVFLYKYLNDKFIYEIKKINKNLSKSKNIISEIQKIKKDDYEMLLLQLNENIAKFRKNHFIPLVFDKQNESNFSEIFDNTLLELSKDNSEIFSVTTSGGEKINLFENISKYISDDRDGFCKAIINKLVKFSFEEIFAQKFDFFASMFEYLIKDYNSNSGGKYAEYFTPHAVARIISLCLINKETKNVSCYDPSSGSGTLLINLAHQIGEAKCTINSQDISQKSSQLLRLNLILNNLVHSIPNVIQGNVISEPFHKDKDYNLKKFDYIVANPPFKLDFSDYRNNLDTKENKDRFFAGIPNIPPKEKESMAIYILFIQHIIFSMKKKGKAAIVVPTGFLTAKSLAKKIREKIIDEKMLTGVINMPSNIFANTGTNVSIMFLDKNKTSDVIFIDGSNLGDKLDYDGIQRTVLSEKDEKLIFNCFNNKKVIEDFSVKVKYQDIIDKNYSFWTGQYFKIKIKYEKISKDEFNKKIEIMKNDLKNLFDESERINSEISNNINKIKYE